MRLLEPDSDSVFRRKHRVAELLVDDCRTLLNICLSFTRGRLNDALRQARLVLDEIVEIHHRTCNTLVAFAIPELFQWYYKALVLYDARSISQLLQHCAFLNNLLFTLRLRSTNDYLLCNGMLLYSDASGRVVFPEGDVSLSTSNAHEIFRVQIENGELRLQDGPPNDQTIQVAMLLRRENGQISAQSVRIPLWQSGWGLRRVVEKCEQECNRLYSVSSTLEIASLRSRSGGSAPDQRDVLSNEALLLIGTTWPELLAEIGTVTVAISFLEGGSFVGGSDAAYQGVTLLKSSPVWTPICFADHIVHEGAHHSLHLMNEVEKLLRNPSFMGAPSPIRSDPRPLYNTLHATFVFARLTLFFGRLIEVVGPSPEALARLHRHFLGLVTGNRVLSKYAEFSDVGEVLGRELLAAETQTRANIGEPDPTFYNAVGTTFMDYESHSVKHGRHKSTVTN